MELMNLVREWVRAEIEFAFAQRDEDEEGYRSSAPREEAEADRLFRRVVEMLSEGVK